MGPHAGSGKTQAPTGRSGRPTGWAPALGVAALTGALYLITARFVVMLNDPINLGAGFWPGAGITVTALLLCRTSWWPAILLAVGMAEFVNDMAAGYDLVATAWWTVANMAESLAAAWLVRRLRVGGFASVRDIAGFVISAAVVAPIIGGLLGAAGTVAHGSSFSYLAIALRWSIGDGLGILTLAPAALLLLRDQAARRRLRTPEAAAVMLAVAVACPVVFYFAPGDLTGPYLMVPLLLWAAIRFQVVGAAVATTITAQFISVATGLGYGTFADRVAAGQGILSLQQYLATMTVTLLVVGASTQESLRHQRTAASEQRRADIEDMLARLAQAALDSEDHEQLRQRATPILAPVIGQMAVEELFDVAAEGNAHVEDGAEPGGPEERTGPFAEGQASVVQEAGALLRSARRRIDAEQRLVAALGARDASSQLVRLLLESTGQGLYGIDLDGRCTFANRSCAQLLGYDDPAALHGQVMHDLIHHTRADGTPNPIEGCLMHQASDERRDVHSQEEMLFRRDGTSFPAAYRCQPVQQGGELIGAVVTFADVTEQQVARLRLQSSEARFRGVFEAANTGITMTDRDGRFAAANPYFCAMLGYSEEEVLQGTLAELSHPEEIAHNMALLDRLFAGNVPTYRVEKRYVRKDGEILWADVSVSLARDEDGQPLHTVATIADITARKHAELQLRHSETLQRVAGALARVGGWAVEMPGRTVSYSDEVRVIMECSGKDGASLDAGLARYAVERREEVAAAVEACAAHGTPFDLEFKIATYKGNMLWLRVVAEAERAEDGTITRVVGALQDITDRQAAVAASEELAERLQTTVESITDAFFTVDLDWRFTYVNHRAETLLQRPRSELLGHSVWEEFPEAVGTAADDAYHRAMREGTTEVIEEYYYPPLHTWFNVRAYPSAQGLAVYFQDITEHRQARRKVAEREARLAQQAALLDKANDAILVRDLQGRITYWNRSAERLYGWAAEEVMGQRSHELLHAESEVFSDAHEVLLATGEWLGELRPHDRSGRELIIESRWTLVRDDAGEPTSVLVIATDIAERKHLEAQLLRAQRMESIGTLAGGLAHDLNNALTPIMMSTGLLQSDETDEWRLAMLDTIATSTTRAADMVTQIVSFARGVEGRRLTVDIESLLRDVQRIADDTFLKTVQVVLEDTPGLWPVLGDPTQLHQVLINLCVNARDAMPGGGTLRLAADTVIVDDQYAALSGGAATGQYVRIRVEDNGSGMPPDVMDRIFEPFYTTKEQGKGTGLGLSISTGIISSHGGFIIVYSEVGKGSRFIIHLPVALGAVPAALEVDATVLPEGNGETILVVDDEQQIRTILRGTLEAFHYRVLDAAGGPDAVALLAQQRDDVDVVLIDMMMPGMDGPATIGALRGVRSDVPIIAASGLHAQAMIARSDELGVHDFLPKPFSIMTLLQTLRAVLTKGAP